MDELKITGKIFESVFSTLLKKYLSTYTGNSNAEVDISNLEISVSDKSEASATLKIKINEEGTVIFKKTLLSKIKGMLEVF